MTCQCSTAGYCSTHRRWMSELRHRQCRDEPGYFQAFQIVHQTHAQTSRPRCIHMGEVLRREPCNCGGSTKIPIHACSQHKRCIRTAAEHRSLQDSTLRRVMACCEICTDHTPGGATPQQLVTD